MTLDLQAWQTHLNGRPDPLSAELMARVWPASRFVEQHCLRADDQAYAHMALWGEPDADDALAARLQLALADVTDEAQLESTLRRYRNREMARIIWRDISELADLDETLLQLSLLAEACVSQALDWLYAQACEKEGVPRDREGRAQQLMVLGMGKLGARELNLSSDIDLIFVFPEHGRCDGRRQLENEAFFTQLGRKLINVLSRQTMDGFVFRVDMRLRPFGDSGPLSVSTDAMENYLHTQAREWERYAMVKARILTGDQDDAEALQAIIDRFVYRRYIDFGVIESIREMKQMIERDLRRKGMDANIKLGWGGIREVEFIGQAFQLVRGGRDVDLQIRPIQQVLGRLGDKDLMPADAVEGLIAAYRFLRRVENHLQAWNDEQTHSLPKDEMPRKRLATALGFADWASLELELERHRALVHAQFDLVFQVTAHESEQVSQPLATVWQAPEAPSNPERLQQAGFAAPEAVLEKLQTFKQLRAVRALPAAASKKLDQLMPMLLAAIAEKEAPELVLQRLLDLLGGVVQRTAYLDLLVENPPALAQLVRLLGESAWVGVQLARQPILLDELLDPRRLYSPMHADELRAELQTLLRSVDEGDQEQEMERLRQFALGNKLRVAAADITGAIPLNVVSDYLTEIAEVSLQQCVRSAWRDVSLKHGRPKLDEAFEQGFAVIGYGKLGGIELGYGSDLDLVFLHASDKASAMTDGERPVANDVFYARLGQRVIHLLTTRMPSGQLYEADMRLRPNGNSGMLVSSLAAYQHYQASEAWTWEHQALVRARAVAGDPALIARFQQIRRAILCQPRDSDQLRADVVSMRAKMAKQLDRSDQELFDIKQGAGGLVDIEFAVQYAVLRWAHDYPDLVVWSDNARLLVQLEEYGLLRPGAAEQLYSAYRVFRACAHRAALQDRKSLIRQDELVEERAMVRDIWQELLGD